MNQKFIKNNNSWLLIIIIVLMLLSFAIITHFYFKKVKKRNEQKISRRRPSYLLNKPKIIDEKEKTYNPKFIINIANENITAKLLQSGAIFYIYDSLGKYSSSIISNHKYKNISSLVCNLDLTQLNKYNFINTSLYLINYYNSSKITILDSIGTSVFKSSSNFKNEMDSNQNNSILNNSINTQQHPFTIKMQIEYSNPATIKIQILQNDEISEIYRENVNYDDLVDFMKNGYHLVFSIGQEYIPNKSKFQMKRDFITCEINNVKIRGREIK